jgi:hypothetical protein
MSVQLARQPERVEDKLTSRTPCTRVQLGSVLNPGSLLDSADYLQLPLFRATSDLTRAARMSSEPTLTRATRSSTPHHAPHTTHRTVPTDTRW